METSDDPVIKEAERAVKKVDREFSRVLDQTREYGEQIVSPLIGQEGPVEERKRRELEDKAFYRSQVGPAATPGPDPTGPAASVPRRITPSGDTRRKKQRAAASVLTRDWLPPTLGTPGLLGV